MVIKRTNKSIQLAPCVLTVTNHVNWFIALRRLRYKLNRLQEKFGAENRMDDFQIYRL